MTSVTGPAFQTTLHLTAAFYAGQLAAGELLDQLSSGKTSKRDTHLSQQASQLHVKLKTAEHTEQVLEQDVTLIHAMADAVKSAETVFNQIIELLTIADDDGCISTERADIQSQIRALRGEIYRTLERAQYLGKNVLRLDDPGVHYVGASLTGAIGLVDKLTDSRLMSIYNTLDAISLSSQSAAETALLTVQNLQKETFDTIKHTVLSFSDAMDVELCNNRAYQLSLANRLNALQGVSIPELLSEFNKQNFMNDTIISAILSSETVNQTMLHLFKYTPIETIDRLSSDWLDPSKK